MMNKEIQQKNEADFICAVLQGLNDVEEGRVVSLEAVKARFQVRIDNGRFE